MNDVIKTTINTTKNRRRLARILAAHLNQQSVSKLLDSLLQREINAYFSAEEQQRLLEYRDEPPKDEIRPQEEKQAAS